MTNQSKILSESITKIKGDLQEEHNRKNNDYTILV